MSVAAQAMGIGNWIFCGYYDGSTVTPSIRTQIQDWHA